MTGLRDVEERLQSLGQVAGLGASLIASGSSLVATLFAIGMGRFYDGATTNLSIGFLAAGIGALILSEIARRSDVVPVEAVR